MFEIFGPIFEKSVYFGPIFEKSVNFEHFVNGKWSHYKSNLANLYKPCFHSQVKSQYQKRISDCQVLVNKYKVDIESKNDEIRKLKLHVNASSGLPTNSIEYFLFAI